MSICSIEDVAANDPDALVRLHIDPLEGFQPWIARSLVYGAGVSDPSEQKQIAEVYGLEVIDLEYAWTEVVKPADVEAALAATVERQSDGWAGPAVAETAASRPAINRFDAMKARISRRITRLDASAIAAAQIRSMPSHQKGL